MTHTVATPVSSHAARQMQRRGVRRATVVLVLEHGDRSRKLAGAARAVWISAGKARRLVRRGLPAAEVDRSRGLRVIVSLLTDTVITCEHATRRRHWA